MLMAGKQVTLAGDQLTQVSVERVYEEIINAKSRVAGLVQQLRALKVMQPDAYRKAKTQLPYIVCGMFIPPVRRRENFAYAEHFMLDIDKLSSVNLSINEVRNRLLKDDRIALMFVSPGNDGLKVLFNLAARIHDSAYYSSFYKRFASRFAITYGLQGAVDLVTSDVSRCCFMSSDSQAYFNPLASSVDAALVVSPHSLQEIKLIEDEVKQVELLAMQNQKENGKAAEKVMNELPDDILARIKQKLEIGRNTSVVKQKSYVQPSQLDEAMPALIQSLSDLNISLAGQKPIHYGRQLKVTAGGFWAEINLFYGKGGFKAVQTTKTGSHPQLAEMGALAIQQHFDNLMIQPFLNHAEAQKS